MQFLTQKRSVKSKKYKNLTYTNLVILVFVYPSTGGTNNKKMTVNRRKIIMYILWTKLIRKLYMLAIVY